MAAITGPRAVMAATTDRVAILAQDPEVPATVTAAAEILL